MPMPSAPGPVCTATEKGSLLKNTFASGNSAFARSRYSNSRSGSIPALATPHHQLVLFEIELFLGIVFGC